jgi:hypothetical protein
MTAAERALSIFRAGGGVLKTQSAMKLGIHPRTFYALRDDQLLERLDRGLYRVVDGKPLGNPDFVTVALKVPKGVICLISALAFHQMTAQVPHTVYLAIPANDQAPVLRYPPLRLFWYSRTALEDVVTTVDMDGIKVRIYSVERTLADCFKYRNKIGIDEDGKLLETAANEVFINVNGPADLGFCQLHGCCSVGAEHSLDVSVRDLAAGQIGSLVIPMGQVKHGGTQQGLRLSIHPQQLRSWIGFAPPSSLKRGSR